MGEFDDSESARSLDEERSLAVTSWVDVELSSGDQVRLAFKEPPDLPSDNAIDRGSVQRIAKFEIVSVIGRGGCGTVLLVRDPDLSRLRALKVANPETLGSLLARSRFLDEGKLAARVEHPNVVRVYEAETAGDLPYIVMEYCPEGSLDRWLESRPKRSFLPQRWVASFAAEIADGVREAHRSGLLHRDLKPANILLVRVERTREDGGKLPRFAPKIADFGLAKVLEAESVRKARTVAGTPIGTWSYMSPEQARGDRQINETTDVYAIGAILYELLSGVRPYEGLSREEILGHIQNFDPHPSPRIIRRDLDRDLEMICLTCLEKLPGCRYPGPAELAADLRRYLAGQPVKARRLAPVLRAVHWVKRHPASAGLLLSLGIGLACLPAVYARVRDFRADSVLRTFLAKEIEAAPKALGDLDRFRVEIEPKLQAWLRQGPPDLRANARAVLALLHFDPDRLEALHEHLLACGPREQAIILDSLRDHPPSHPILVRETDRLWGLFEDTGAPAAKRLRAACYLANWCKEDLRWMQQGSIAADLLIEATASSPTLEENVHMARLLRPIREHLYPHLEHAVADVSQTPSSLASAWVLTRLAADSPDLLAKYALGADLRRFGILAAAIPPGDPRSLAILRAEMADRVGAHSPLVTFNKRNSQIANAAALLIRDGRGEEVWPALKETAVHPGFRPFLIQCAHEANVAPDRLLEPLDSTAPLTRRTLILCLGSFPSIKISDKDRQAIINRLLGLYMTDPDPGVHSSLSWLLRKWQVGAKVDQLNVQLSDMALLPNKDWYQESEGHTLAIIHGPSTVQSRVTSAVDSPLEERTIPYSFAVATMKVTVGQYVRFLEAKKPPFASSPPMFRNRHYDPITSPGRDCPINGIDFDHAARYSNWISECNGISVEQWCYERDPTSEIGRMRPVARFLEKTGYRLLTENERVFACRARTESSFYFGESAAMSPFYEWTAENSTTTCTEPVGLKMPNDFGLHDMLGLIYEWTMAHPSRSLVRKQLHGGGSFQVPAVKLSPLNFGIAVEDFADGLTSMRIARTLPASTGLSPVP